MEQLTSHDTTKAFIFPPHTHTHTHTHTHIKLNTVCTEVGNRKKVTVSE